MENLQDTLYINVEYYIDELYGPTYVASADRIGLLTDGHTFPELLINLKDAIAVCLEGTDTVKEFNLVHNPRVIIAHTA
jgi:predicted RNase H-like HicB family nuclease